MQQCIHKATSWQFLAFITFRTKGVDLPLVDTCLTGEIYLLDFFSAHFIQRQHCEKDMALSCHRGSTENPDATWQGLLVLLMTCINHQLKGGVLHNPARSADPKHSHVKAYRRLPEEPCQVAFLRIDRRGAGRLGATELRMGLLLGGRLSQKHHADCRDKDLVAARSP